MMGEMGSFGFGSDFGWLLMAAFWILIIVGLVAIVKWIFTSSGSGASAAPTKTALDILKERYARGDIDRDEFEQKKSDLERN